MQQPQVREDVLAALAIPSAKVLLASFDRRAEAPPPVPNPHSKAEPALHHARESPQKPSQPAPTICLQWRIRLVGCTGVGVPTHCTRLYRVVPPRAWGEP
jgi:hypothetical protein